MTKKKTKIKFNLIYNKYSLSIMGLLILFFAYNYTLNSGFFSEENFYSCEVGMVKKQNAKFDGGPKIMVLKFNLKTKLPNAYIYNPKFGSGFSSNNGVFKLVEYSNTYELKFELTDEFFYPTIAYEGYSGNRAEAVNEFIINRTDLKIRYIKITRRDVSGKSYSPINKWRTIEYGNCVQATKPINKI